MDFDSLDLLNHAPLLFEHILDFSEHEYLLLVSSLNILFSLFHKEVLFKVFLDGRSLCHQVLEVSVGYRGLVHAPVLLDDCGGQDGSI